MRSILAILLAVGCGAASIPDVGAPTTPPTSNAATADEPGAGGVVQIDGLLFAACALETCPEAVRADWASLDHALAPIATAPERTPPLVEAEREVWSRSVLEPYIAGVRAGIEADIGRLYAGAADDSERALRYWIAVLVWYRRFADYLDRNGAGPPNADRGGCGVSLAVTLYRTLETARDAAEHCAAAAPAVPAMASNAARCADAEAALRARLALEVDDGVICDPEVPR